LVGGLRCAISPEPQHVKSPAFAAIGWSTTLPFCSIIIVHNGKSASYKKWPVLSLPVLPAFLIVHICRPNGLNPAPYQLHQKYGWNNVAENDVWDWIFYVYISDIR
jgi:hypothetical protein